MTESPEKFYPARCRSALGHLDAIRLILKHVRNDKVVPNEHLHALEGELETISIAINNCRAIMRHYLKESV